MLLRLVTVALCAATLVMLANVELVRLELGSRPAPRGPGSSGCPRFELPAGAGHGPGRPRGVLAAAADDARAGARINVVDVASGVAPERIAAMIRLGPGEYISAVNDRAVDTDAEVDAAIVSAPWRPGQFLDLAVSSAVTERRVLVLQH